MDITDDLLNLFVRFDVQRRFFNIVSMEILAQQFGLKEPPSLKQLKKDHSSVSLANLIMNGRNLTLEQYFEVKKEFESNHKGREQLIRDRQTFMVYGSESEGDCSNEEDVADDRMDFTTAEEPSTINECPDYAEQSSERSQSPSSHSSSADSSDSDKPVQKGRG